MSRVGLSVQFSSTFLDAQANYSCASGYNINGSASITCLISGNWSDDTPVCDRMLAAIV